jgi:L-alanine-DL-glutamate epimerase-like enolase superfamily enzyme
MGRLIAPILLLVVVAFALLGCASDVPLMSGGGAAARGGNADGTTGTVEPVTAYGPIGGATATKLGYQRQETGSQAAPAISLNLQPEAGASASASYPALGVIVFQPIIVMGNSQRDSTLSSDQLERLANVAEKAGEAAKGAIDASGSAASKAATRLAEAVAPPPPVPAPSNPAR